MILGVWSATLTLPDYRRVARYRSRIGEKLLETRLFNSRNLPCSAMLSAN
jgi:hypothetical protein